MQGTEAPTRVGAQGHPGRWPSRPEGEPGQPGKADGTLTERLRRVLDWLELLGKKYTEENYQGDMA